MSERATFQELLDFANAVREAGGGNPLDALMPAVPEDPSRCLIARNLNFNCAVNGTGNRWYMYLQDEETANRIGEALDLEVEQRSEFGKNDDGEEVIFAWAVVLPSKIGQVALDFDHTNGILWDLDNGVSLDDISERERELVTSMVPFIEASEEEARRLASIVNPDGSIVI